MVGLRRAWGAPLWAHVMVLTVFLLALVPVLGTTFSFSPDEAVAITQARSLSRGEGWIVEHPFANIDPDNRFFPVAGSDRGEQGMAPFAKHPVYPLLLASADRVGGTAAMVVLSVLGTVAAAGFAALLAREVTGGRERAVLWAVGVASPLLFDAYLLMAHSMGAALVTAATLAVVRGIRSSRPALPVAVGIGLVVAAVLLRTEALIFALALGVAMLVAAVRQRRWASTAWGMAIAGAGIGTALLERQFRNVVIGSSGGSVTVPAVEGGFFESRLEGFLNTWIRPTSSMPSGMSLLLVIVTVIAVAAVVILRWRRIRPQMLVMLSVVATVLTSVAFFAEPDRVIPGLLVAFPLAVFGIGLVDRSYFEPAGRLVLTVTVALFLGGVLATQYSVGGSSEWGGRYFALAIPLLTVLAVDALARRAALLDVPVRRWAGAGLLVCTALLSVGAMASIKGQHDYNELLLARIDQAAQSTTPGDRGSSVVISPWGNIARLAWPTHSPQRWLYNPEKTLADELASLLGKTGVNEVLFVGQQPEEVDPYLAQFAVDEGRSFEEGKWKVLVLVRRAVAGPE